MSDYLKNIDFEMEEKANILLGKVLNIEPKEKKQPSYWKLEHMVSETLKEVAHEAYKAGAEEVPILTEKLKKYYEDFKGVGAGWIGEDGDACCYATTPLGALRKFKALTKSDVGEIEASELVIEQVKVGYMHLPDYEDFNPDDCEWFVHYSEEKKNQYPLFVYRN